MTGGGVNKSDNRNLEAKLLIRLNWLDSLDQNEVRVLDAFGGEGVIWGEIEKLRPEVTIYRTGIEKNRKKGDTSTLYGDNMQYLPHVSLDVFDAIDLDSYGWPTDQLTVIADRVPQMHVFVTCGMWAAGDPTSAILESAGIPHVWGPLVPGIWGKFHLDLWDAFLADLGYRSTERVVAPQVKAGVMVYEHLWPVGSDGDGLVVDD